MEFICYLLLLRDLMGLVLITVKPSVAVSRWRYIHLTASTLQVFILNIFPLPCVENKHRISSGGVVGSILRC